jgi:hypothetical protein
MYTHFWWETPSKALIRKTQKKYDNSVGNHVKTERKILSFVSRRNWLTLLSHWHLINYIIRFFIILSVSSFHIHAPFCPEWNKKSLPYFASPVQRVAVVSLYEKLVHPLTRLHGVIFVRPQYDFPSP